MLPGKYNFTHALYYRSKYNGQETFAAYCSYIKRDEKYNIYTIDVETNKSNTKFIYPVMSEPLWVNRSQAEYLCQIPDFDHTDNDAARCPFQFVADVVTTAACEKPKD